MVMMATGLESPLLACPMGQRSQQVSSAAEFIYGIKMLAFMFPEIHLVMMGIKFK